jgi:hypothetical protein
MKRLLFVTAVIIIAIVAAATSHKSWPEAPVDRSAKEYAAAKKISYAQADWMRCRSAQPLKHTIRLRYADKDDRAADLATQRYVRSGECSGWKGGEQVRRDWEKGYDSYYGIFFGCYEVVGSPDACWWTNQSAIEVRPVD